MDRKRLRDWEKDYDKLMAVSKGSTGVLRDSKRLPSGMMCVCVCVCVCVCG